jgi:hypothetical protein
MAPVVRGTCWCCALYRRSSGPRYRTGRRTYVTGYTGICVNVKWYVSVSSISSRSHFLYLSSIFSLCLCQHDGRLYLTLSFFVSSTIRILTLVAFFLQPRFSFLLSSGCVWARRSSEGLSLWALGQGLIDPLRLDGLIIEVLPRVTRGRSIY